MFFVVFGFFLGIFSVFFFSRVSFHFFLLSFLFILLHSLHSGRSKVTRVTVATSTTFCKVNLATLKVAKN